MIYVTLVRQDRIGFSDIAGVRWRDRFDRAPMSVPYSGPERSRKPGATVDEWCARQAFRSVREVPEAVITRLRTTGCGVIGAAALPLYTQIVSNAFDAATKNAPAAGAGAVVEIDSTRMTPAEFEQHMKRKFQKAWDMW